MHQQRALLLALAFGGGVLQPLQALINARLSGYLQSPFLATAIQNLVGASAALLIAVIYWPPRLSFAQAAQTPIWAWTGGLIGIFFVLGGLVVAPRLGVTAMMASVIFGQLLSSLLLDQFGIMHPRRPIDAQGILGILLLLAGSVLILRRG
jgi:transporter family-2 protein